MSADETDVRDIAVSMRDLVGAVHELTQVVVT